jgi:hypothetical protein
MSRCRSFHIDTMRLYSQTIVAQRLKRKAQENTDTQIQTQIVDLEDFSSAHPTQEAASSSARRRLTRARSRLNISLMHATHRLISVIATTTDPLVQGPPMAMQVHQQTCGARMENNLSPSSPATSRSTQKSHPMINCDKLCNSLLAVSFEQPLIFVPARLVFSFQLTCLQEMHEVTANRTRAKSTMLR